MARGEHEPEQVVADVVVEGVERVVDLRRLGAPLEIASELLVLALQRGAPAQHVDRVVLRRGHEPGARIVRDA